MIRLALWLLGGLLLGGIVHLATVLMLPRMATQDAYARVSAVAPISGHPDAATHAGKGRHAMGPAFAVSVCRYDLSRRRSNSGADQPATHRCRLHPHRHRLLRDRDRAAGRRVIGRSVTTEQRAALPEDQEITAADRLIVTSPTSTGLIVIGFWHEPGLMSAARARSRLPNAARSDDCFETTARWRRIRHGRHRHRHRRGSQIGGRHQNARQPAIAKSDQRSPDRQWRRHRHHGTSERGLAAALTSERCTQPTTSWFSPTRARWRPGPLSTRHAQAPRA